MRILIKNANVITPFEMLKGLNVLVEGGIRLPVLFPRAIRLKRPAIKLLMRAEITWPPG